MDRDEPIWITGVGAATPLGCELAEIESNLLAGRSGVSLVTRFPTDDYPSRIAAQLGTIPAPPGLRSAERSRRGRRWTSSRTGAPRRPARRRALGPRIASRASGWCSAWAPSGCSSGRPTTSPAGSRLYDPDQDRESTIERARRELGLSGPALATVGGVRQRQPCAGDRPPLAAARAGRRLRGRGLRPGGHADRPGDVRQPPRSVAAERRPGRRVAPVRPRPRRLRPGRRGRRVRPRAVAATPAAAARTPTPRSPAAAPAATPTTT